MLISTSSICKFSFFIFLCVCFCSFSFQSGPVLSSSVSPSLSFLSLCLSPGKYTQTHLPHIQYRDLQCFSILYVITSLLNFKLLSPLQNRPSFLVNVLYMKRQCVKSPLPVEHDMPASLHERDEY